MPVQGFELDQSTTITTEPQLTTFQAYKYLLDPLNEPSPSEETGPGSHFVKQPSRASSTSKGPAVTSSPRSSTHRKSPSTTSYPTPPGSASPTQSSFHPSNPYSPSHRQTAFGAYNEDGPKRRSLDGKPGNGKGRRRGSSLTEKFPGDMSHRPLDQLRREAKAADRSPHLKKKHLPGADTVDSLDDAVFGGAYHHGGPYDATLLARNTSYLSSPVEAVRGTNAEALRATPRENIRDALDKHVPLQGTSNIPPGMSGLDGKTMHYEEGADVVGPITTSPLPFH
jgi:hypothetical protein